MPAGHTDRVVFFPDGKTLATAGGSPEPAVFLWDARTGDLIRSLKPPDKGGSNALAVSPDGKFFAVGWYSYSTKRASLLLWDLDSGRLLHQPPVTDWDYIWSLSFSPDGKILASAQTDQTLRLWDPATGKEIRQMKAKTGEKKTPHAVQNVQFSPDGKLLASAGRTAVTLWDPATGQEVRRFDKPDGCTGAALAFSPDSKTLAWSCSSAIRLIEVASGIERVSLGGHRQPVQSPAVSPDGRWIATAGDRPRLWDASTAKERPLTGTASRVTCVAFSPDSKSLVSGSHDENITLWDLQSGKKTRQFTGQTGLVDFVTFLPDGKTVLTMSDRHHTTVENRMEPKVRIWDVAQGKQVRGIGPTWIVDAAVSGDCRLLTSYDKVVPVWDVPSGKKRGTVPGLSYPAPLAFSPDGRYLGAVWQNATARRHELTLREIASGQEVHHWEEKAGPRTSLVLALSDRLLAAGCVDGTIRLWDVETGQEAPRLSGHRGAVMSLTFSRDGQRLISGSSDTTALVWDIRDPMPARTGGAATPKQLTELWTDLAGEAPRAVRAIGQLRRSPEQAVPFLREQLRTGLPPEAERVAKLIASLDHDEFAVREKATGELVGLGKQVGPALRRALDERPSPEAQRRLRRILSQLTDESRPPSDVLRMLRAIEILERIGTEESKRIIKALPNKQSDGRVVEEASAALERLEHFGKTWP